MKKAGVMNLRTIVTTLLLVVLLLTNAGCPIASRGPQKLDPT